MAESLAFGFIYVIKEKIMLKLGKEYEIEIVDLGHSGEGIGKVDGFTVFVEGGLVGDIVLGKVVKSKKNYAVADLKKILSSSADRVKPVCPIAHSCGGCQIMQLNYSKQLEIKKDIVVQNLSRIGKVENPNVMDTIGMDNPYNYRNKAQFPVGIDKKGKPVMGFFKKMSHEIIPLTTCYVQDTVNDVILDIIRQYIEKYKISVYDEKTHKGNLRHVVTKVGFHTHEIMVILVTKETKLPKIDALVEMLEAKLPGLRTVVQNINPNRTNVILGRENKIIYGDGIIEDTIDDLVFEISPLSFYQVNPIQTKVLYNKALELADISSEDVVYDIYCGIGTISLFLAKKAKHVYGIEIVKEAIENAKKNAERNNIENASFYAGKAEEVVPELYSRGITADVVVVDPPRKGCEEIVLDTIAKMNPKKIVYISCNPSTLARDVERLSKHGYEMDVAYPVDMFSHTMHVEAIVLMTRSGSGEKK